MTEGEAVQALRRAAGKELDPTLVPLFLKTLEAG
jgi:HD-GYP domain-containing protein (c-di-GMP phosphodiesterase class II)